MTAMLVSPGDVLARRYRIVAPHSTGGTSTLWRAVDEVLDRPVVVKIATGSTREPDHLHREARQAAQISHPGAVEVYDYGRTITSDGRVVPFTVMPDLAGVTVAGQVMRGPLPWRDAVVAAAEIAEVLAVLHEAGVVHQDVSADNVLLTSDGVRLLDFGLATGVGERDEVAAYSGTPPYAAPERVSGAAADPASDVYALGVVLYEMLTGRRPYPEVTWPEVEAVRAHRRPPEPPSAEGLPHAAGDVCVRCLAADAAERPSAAEVARMLRESLSGRRESRALAVVTAVVALALAGTFAAELVDDDGSDQPPPAGVDDGAPAPDLPDPRLYAEPDPYAVPGPHDDMWEAFHAELYEGLATGRVRPDVYLDLSQVAAHVQATGTASIPSDHAADTSPTRAEATESLRHKLDERFSEGALDVDVWERLRDILDR